MRQARAAAVDERVYFAAIPVILIGLVAWLSLHPFNHDNAWLLEATRRWMRGDRLYVDIVEINPPLIFLENAVLSFGLLTKPAYLAGVALVLAISALWLGRWHGPKIALLVCLSLALSAYADFGQRDHLALVFLTPFLLAPDGLSRRERMALGVWAFFGVGLKPHFLLIPAAHILARRSFNRAENWTLGGLCLGWLAVVAVVWPRYFTEIVPLANEVYGAFARPIGARELSLCLLIVALTGFVAIKHRPLLPVAAAALGAVACFLLQGRYWSYHLVPAIGLAAIILFFTRNTLLVTAGAGLLLAQVAQGTRPYPHSFVPGGAKSVLFLSDRVSAAYPASFECGVRNASRYPTFWTLPGAWNAGRMDLFKRELAKANADLKRERPEVILEDIRPERFDRPFRFADWMDLSSYRSGPMAGRYRLWVRNDLRLGNAMKCPR